MAKRKLSSFERLRRGQKLSRRERKEIDRRFQAEDPGWDIVHDRVAGIDVGNESHFVAIDPRLDSQPVREFGSWTAALRETADWLKGLGIKRVVIAYASHCTSLGRCETFSNRSRLDNLRPLAFLGGSGPGSS
jgi:hypothetical protein